MSKKLFWQSPSNILLLENGSLKELHMRHSLGTREPWFHAILPRLRASFASKADFSLWLLYPDSGPGQNTTAFTLWEEQWKGWGM